MTLAFTLLGVSVLLSLLLWLPLLWPVRRAISSAAIVGMSVGAGLTFGLFLSPWSLLLLVLATYQLVNLLRVVENRQVETYLRKSYIHTTLWLVSGQLLALLVGVINYHFVIPARQWWVAIGLFQLLAALVIAWSTRRSLKKINAYPVSKPIPDRDLPNLSVLIPARNETKDLEECLHSLVSSTYPKLEIIVLDDCSQNKQTPEIIRGFAHDGVRFIDGEVPPGRWLAKNYAYQRLSEAANGDLLLFCGVDTRFEPNTLTDMVELLVAKNKQMVSFMPANRPPNQWRLEELLVQPARYAWEIALPRRQVNRPPVLSTCWLIKSSLLKKAGTFKAVANTVTPEGYFAKKAIQASDGYSFISSNISMGLKSAKLFNEQRATAIRTRYPQTHKRPEVTMLLSVIEAVVLIIPFVGLITSAAIGDYLLAGLYLMVCVALMYFFYSVTKQTYRRSIFRSVWLVPFAAIYDIGLLNYSMWQYEFREVIWKNRNICIPAMQVFKELPKID